MGFFSKPKPADFWTWLTNNGDRLKTGDIMKSYREVCQQFDKLKLDLIVEIGMGDGEGPWKLVVSADGISARIPKVREFVAAAPKIPGWEVIAFRQPSGFEFGIQFGDKDVSPETSLYEIIGHEQGHTHVKLYLPLPADAPKDAYTEIGFVLLDHILGELVVMTKLGRIETAHATLAGQTAKPLTDLPSELA